MKTLEKAYEYEEALYANQLMHVELLIEQGDLESCLTIYTDILQDNLHTSPDIWILGALLLLVLGQEEDANEYTHRANLVINRSFESSHRVAMFKGLYIRMYVMQGNPVPGAGVYGVIGAILSRAPVEASRQIPSTLIESVVDRYVELNKVEALLPFFDDRAEQILPGVGKLVQRRLESYGVELEDDGVKIPIVLIGKESLDIMHVFSEHPNMDIVEFSAAEIADIGEELVSVADGELEDILFGEMDFLDGVEENTTLNTVKALIDSKLKMTKSIPIVRWPLEWPISSLGDIFSQSKNIFYLGDPTLHASDSNKLHEWHGFNSEVFNSLNPSVFFLNAKMMTFEAQSTVRRLMAKLGVEEYALDADFDKCFEFNQSLLTECFVSELDQSILKQWKFI